MTTPQCAEVMTHEEAFFDFSRHRSSLATALHHFITASLFGRAARESVKKFDGATATRSGSHCDRIGR
jgi:hypothetical protein